MIDRAGPPAEKVEAMNVLVAYSSRLGSTRGIAARIAEGLPAPALDRETSGPDPNSSGLEKIEP